MFLVLYLEDLEEAVDDATETTELVGDGMSSSTLAVSDISWIVLSISDFSSSTFLVTRFEDFLVTLRVGAVDEAIEAMELVGDGISPSPFVVSEIS